MDAAVACVPVENIKEQILEAACPGNSFAGQGESKCKRPEAEGEELHGPAGDRDCQCWSSTSEWL